MLQVDYCIEICISRLQNRHSQNVYTVLYSQVCKLGGRLEQVGTGRGESGADPAVYEKTLRSVTKLASWTPLFIKMP